MALITSIRKHFWFVLLLLGLALASFVLMDIVGSNGGGGGRGSLTLGEVGGEKISYQDFQNTENVYYRNSGANTYSVKSAIWDYFVEKSIVEKESDGLGLSVSTDELMELQFGNDLSPIMRANWKNPQTNQVDRARLNEYKTAIEAGQPLNPNFRSFWAEQEKQITKSKLQEKLTTMVSKAIYTPKWMSDQKNNLDMDQVKIAYVKVPFTSMTDAVSLTDKDYTQFLNANKAKYTIEEENRVIDCAVFPLKATKADTAKLFDEMMESKMAFIKSSTDSLYAVSNNGSYANFYFEAEKLPASIKDAITTMNIGEAYGPYIENGAYNVVKMIDKKVIADSVHASHILRSVDVSVPGQLEDAQKHIDSIKVLLNNGASFSDIAKTSSQDPGSGAKGGDLGYFQQGAMVPAFNEVCFYGEKDGLKVVRTKFGIHLIKVHNKKYLNRDNKFKLAFIRNAIIPSQFTQDKMYEEISGLLTINDDLASLTTAVQKLGGSFETAAPVKKNDFNFNNLGDGQTSRDIIRWSFENGIEPGDIAPEVFTYTDNVNYYNSNYVLAVVKNINTAGLPNIESMKTSLKSSVESYVRSNNFVTSGGTDMNQIASKYGVKIDTAANVSFTASYVPGIGNEPKVVSKAFRLSVGDTPVTVVGDNALYVISVVDKTTGVDVSGLPQFRNSERDNKRRTIASTLMGSLKKVLKVEDNRNTFF